MGILDWLRPSPALIDGVDRAIASPYAASGELEKIVVADFLGLTETPMSRELAMKVPSIAKGRALICGTLSRFPLRHLANGVEAPPEPWMIRTDRGQDPHQRILWTLDDLIFQGRALWAVERGSRGELLDAARVRPDQWSVDSDGYILINKRRVSSDQVILFQGPQDPLLTMARRTIRGALDLEEAWMNRVSSPVPLVELHITDQNTDLTNEEKKQLAQDWETQRRKGGTAVTPYEIEMRAHGSEKTELFVEGRNAVRLDIANFLNLPSALLEGSLSTATLTYSTTEGQRNELVDYSLKYWAGPIEARLSQDDVVRRGHAVEFDLDWLDQRDTEPPTRKD